MLSALLLAGTLLGFVDTSQTVYALSHGYVERNPMWRSNPPGLTVVMKTGLDVGLSVGLHRVGQGHRKTALVAALALVLIRGTLVARNAHILRGH